MVDRRRVDVNVLARMNAVAVVELTLMLAGLAALFFFIEAGVGFELLQLAHRATPAAVQAFDLSAIASIGSHALFAIVALPLLVGLISTWLAGTGPALAGSTVRLVACLTDRLLRFARVLSHLLPTPPELRRSVNIADLTAVVRQLCDALVIAPTGPPSERAVLVVSSSFIGRPAT